MPSDSNPLGLDADSPSYYRRLDEHTYQPTLHTQGAWQPTEQHMAPVSGLMTHCLEEFNPREDLQLARISFDILGMITAAPTTVECRTIRRGRTIELDEAVLSVEGRAVVRAQAWRLSRQDTSEVAGGQPPALPGPDHYESRVMSEQWAGGYIASLEVRRDPGTVPGDGRSWLRTTKTLVEDTDVSDIAAYVGLVDTANGVATRVEPGDWMFPNVDLGIHLYRTPIAGWIGFDTRVLFGEEGLGLTSSTLHDIRGPVGRAEQILTVRPMPNAT
ncbi:MAG: thioesterase family protein [Mobilicoccus sp.]|nr:thioesterase family protein [Mobilicoccus sp.]